MSDTNNTPTNGSTSQTTPTKPWYDEEPNNTTDGGKLNNSADYQHLMDTIDDMLHTWEKYDKITHPVSDELDQFRKSWFYNNWCVRFRQLMAFTPLGTRGVIAIPNTTFEEWLWWFHEWAEAFMDDYNEFKKLVFHAISVIEKHLEIIDKEIEDIDKEIDEINKHLQKIDKEIEDIDKHLSDIDKEIIDIYHKIDNLQHEVDKNTSDISHNTQIINNNNTKTSSEISALWNSVLQIHTVHSYSVIQQGIYKNPDAPAGLGDLTVNWWYLNDQYPDMGYQMTIGANWILWKGKYANFPQLSVDLTPVAPKCSVRPGELCAGYGAWAYGTTGIMVNMPNTAGYLPIVIMQSNGEPNHATIHFSGPLGADPSLVNEDGLIGLYQGNGAAPLISYLNSNWEPPQLPPRPTTSTSTTTTTTTGTTTGTPSTGTTAGKSPATGSTSTGTTAGNSPVTGTPATGTTVTGGTTDGKSTATTTTPTVTTNK